MIFCNHRYWYYLRKDDTTNSKNIQNTFLNNRNDFRKPLIKLNLIDNFLFSTFMENPEYSRELVKLIIKRATGRTLENFTIESQKMFNGIDTDRHGICLDVLIKEKSSFDNTKEVYNIEPNTYYDANIARRNRYYNSLTDSKLLFSGKDYDTLPELITIWILSYDPFGDNRMVYSVKNLVTENPSIGYNDGVTTLFLNTKGKIGGSEELANLLRFFSETNEDTAVDSDLRDIQRIVDTIKGDSKVGDKYMGMRSEIYYEKKISFTEGKAEGISEGEEMAKIEIAKRLKDLGVDHSIIEQAIANGTE
ncbi:MAG: Rpn family recombination-promoting nuclease/putative transposase [Lachnospiraceae bacterium]|nr:Rpn family recombination-promoting nuclease/putative transposase [Lachnospiraceae bacterium]